MNKRNKKGFSKPPLEKFVGEGEDVKTGRVCRVSKAKRINDIRNLLSAQIHVDT